MWNTSCSPQKNKKERKCNLSGVSVTCGYQQPTVSSRTRALSPYTHRKMCQLSEDSRQRLSHLQLGPHYFRKETECPTPFLVCSIRRKKKKTRIQSMDKNKTAFSPLPLPPAALPCYFCFFIYNQI
uniref:Uncharacterized protein n=1 Tax=Amphilophus citrinellus TaxID=61819 RepID=A0A3Q0RNN2_AMPCI